MRWRILSSVSLLFCLQNVLAATNPIAWNVSSGSLPSQTNYGNHYLITYTFTSQLPFKMPTPLLITKKSSSNEFIFSDQCSGKELALHESCRVTIGFTPTSAGSKSAQLTMIYGNNTIVLPPLNTVTASATLDANWTGLIGVDYNPNHYASGNAFNNHDVFYTNTGNGNAVSNTYMEMAQLQAAGFNVVRSYQTVEYAWIDIINQAAALGLKVIYEAAIPYDGNSANITAAVSVLTNVINAVGVSTFNNTVILVLAGHENYNGSNIDYLTNAVTQLQTTLTNAGINIPVGSAVVSGNLVTPGNPQDMKKLIQSYSPTAPLGFDPYPFQWGATPPNQAATNIALTNSIAWDYAQVQAQTIFYVSPRPILMAETGWATSGSGQFADYYCYTQNNCAPSVPNAAAYLTALYQFVNTPSNNSGALVFEAYDEPAKDPTNPTDAENFYGVFDQNCNLKNNDTALLPNSSFSTTANRGCQGYVSGALLSVTGSQPGNATNQPPFTVQVTQTNPTTSQSASYTATVPNENRTNTNIYPWPLYLIFNNASITITGLTSGAACTVPVTVSGTTITFGTMTCTNPFYTVTCSNNQCFLPWNNF